MRRPLTNEPRRPRRWLLSVAGCAAVTLLAAAAGAASGSRGSSRAPLWDVSGRWDGFNGAEYVVFRQRSEGRLAVTVHHTCAPGHLERGRGHIHGGHVRARVEPVSKPPPPACVNFAIIDVRVAGDGRRMRGSFTTDRGNGGLLYFGARRARSLVRFRPRIAPAHRTGSLQVFLRPRPRLPAGATARVSLCRARSCLVRDGRFGPVFRIRGERCGLFVARVSFAGARASTRRRICA